MTIPIDWSKRTIYYRNDKGEYVPVPALFDCGKADPKTLEQMAEEYASYVDDDMELRRYKDLAENGFVAGHASRQPEVERLTVQNKIMREALEQMDAWFEEMKADQGEKLGHGLQAAIDNWPTLKQPFDMMIVKSALYDVKELDK